MKLQTKETPAGSLAPAPGGVYTLINVPLVIVGVLLLVFISKGVPHSSACGGMGPPLRGYMSAARWMGTSALRRNPLSSLSFSPGGATS